MTDYRYMCSDPGQQLIKDAIRDKGLTGVVVAACSLPCMSPRSDEWRKSQAESVQMRDGEHSRAVQLASQGGAGEGY